MGYDVENCAVHPRTGGPQGREWVFFSGQTVPAMPHDCAPGAVVDGVIRILHGAVRLDDEIDQFGGSTDCFGAAMVEVCPPSIVSWWNARSAAARVALRDCIRNLPDV